MAETASFKLHAPGRGGPAVLCLGLGAAALSLSLFQLFSYLPATHWAAALFRPDERDIPELLVHFSFLPRLCVSLLAGWALGLAGTLFQQVLRNPLAEPSTLGVASGAFLAVAVAGTWLPALASDWAALAGAFGALALVLAIAAPRHLAPTATILAGLMVSLTCGAVGTAIALFHDQTSANLFLWGAGSLNQNSWSIAAQLAPEVIVATLVAAAMIRPLVLLGLDDAAGTGLGLPVAVIRLVFLLLAAAVTALVTSAIGVVGFVGLAAPALARVAGARRFGRQLLWSPAIGAVLLWLADQMVQQFSQGRSDVSTGAVVALAGVPCMIWLLPRLRPGAPTTMPAPVARCVRPGRALLLGTGLLLAAMLASIVISRSIEGLTIDDWSSIAPFLYWRLPRMVAALSAGAMLAVAGMILQRVTGNIMASPELFGISSGAALGLVVLVFSRAEYSGTEQMIAATLGAAAALAGMMVLATRSRFAPEQVLLGGVATNALAGAVIAVLSGTGDLRIYTVLRWLSGSTYLTTPTMAATAALAAAGLVGATMLTMRWLAILPLGLELSCALGVRVGVVRSLMLSLAGLLTVAATLIVGPLSFVGLMAPTMARMAGFERPAAQLAAGLLIGALIMIAADWLGRVILFPNQFPVGLLSTLIGAPFFLILLRKR